MAGDKELKLVVADFDTVASSLTEDKDALDLAKDALSASNDKMKSDWLGDGGNAFIISAKAIEEEFKVRISELEGEINDLLVAKSTMFALDTHLANKINTSIDGITVNISGNTENNNDSNKIISI